MRAPHPNASRGRLDLERALKWKFILPIIIMLLRKPPLANGTKAKLLEPIVKHRLDMNNSGDWRGLVREYECDVYIAASMHRQDNRGEGEKDLARIWKAADLLSRF